ncbi:hypothetical protein CA600_08390 [Paenibacillus sp. VTT E-133280]|uniref:hypothetical protein n=1 Tax=Paenibacillus sp. VTT E-133280 TaxID=1986222 RepID=UPI000BA09C9B|nr:hypothetical protein [Paenibacillus sp. VTT E-133280]OZQ67685.1 hypothetical protein CA600_08390 [Paenibacillus sp. VTT E-133280]
MKYTLQIMPNWINDWFFLDNILQDLHDLHEVQEIELDFYFLFDVHPKGVVMLLTISNNLFQITNTKIKIKNIYSGVLSYLEKIKFLNSDLFNIDYDSIIFEDVLERPIYDSGIDITHITSPKEKIKLVSDVKEMLEIWFPEDKYRMLKHSTLSSLMELCGNSLEHSGLSESSGSCFVMMQKSLLRDFIEVNIVTTDLGIGIKNHQERKYGTLYSNDYQYIKKALAGISGRLDNTGGFGLQTIQNSIKENNGQLIIKSGRGTVSISNENSHIEGQYSLPGTQCAITLRKPMNHLLTIG